MSGGGRLRRIGTAGTPTKVFGFAAVLVLVFGGAWAAGAGVGPIGSQADSDAPHGHDGTGRVDQGEHGGKKPMNETTPGAGALPGLAVARDGYRLVLHDTVVEPGDR